MVMRLMIAKKSIFFVLLLATALVAGSCNKYSYYYRDKEAKVRDCEKQTGKSNKYKSKK